MSIDEIFKSDAEKSYEIYKSDKKSIDFTFLEFCRHMNKIIKIKNKNIKKIMETTTIKMIDGKELDVRGSVEDIIKNYNKKPNTEVIPSRMVDGNFTILINGKNVGEIVSENISEAKVIVGWEDESFTFNGKKVKMNEIEGEFKYRGKTFSTVNHTNGDEIIADLGKAFPKDKFVYDFDINEAKSLSKTNQDTLNFLINSDVGRRLISTLDYHRNNSKNSELTDINLLNTLPLKQQELFDTLYKTLDMPRPNLANLILLKSASKIGNINLFEAKYDLDKEYISAKKDIQYSWDNPISKSVRISREWIYTVDPETMTFVKALFSKMGGNHSLYTTFTAIMKYKTLKELLKKESSENVSEVYNNVKKMISKHNINLNEGSLSIVNIIKVVLKKDYSTYKKGMYFKVTDISNKRITVDMDGRKVDFGYSEVEIVASTNDDLYRLGNALNFIQTFGYISRTDADIKKAVNTLDLPISKKLAIKALSEYLSR